MRLVVLRQMQGDGKRKTLSSCASDMMAEYLLERDLRPDDKHTGGSTLPRGIGCGATGADGADSAQNQPILTRRYPKQNQVRAGQESA